MHSSNLRSVWARIRPILIIGVIVATIGLFVWFFASNQEALQQVRNIGLGSVVLIILLYLAMTANLAAVYMLSLRMCGTKVTYKENWLITSYSSIVNFFGPLQSGLGFRMAYLKKRHNVPLRSYAFVSALYYAGFALISAAYIMAGVVQWWAVALGTVFLGCISIVALRLYARIKGVPVLNIKLWDFVAFVLAIVIQLATVALIYTIELRSIGEHLGFRQILAYTGTANFALFVSFTPGALGFREALLLFTREITGLSSTSIVAANLIDRTVYVMFLALLFLIILLTVGRSRLRALKAA